MRTMTPAARRLEDEFDRALDGATTVDPAVRTLVAVAAAVRPAPVTMDPQFRTRLREQLLSEQVLPRQRPAGGDREPADPAEPPRSERWLFAVAGCLAAVLGVGAVGAHAASGALPGDRLYGAKRAIEELDLSFAKGDLAVGRAYLDHADTRLSESERITGHSGPAASRTARLVPPTLTDYRGEALAGSRNMLTAYDTRPDPDVLATLDRRIATQEQRLVSLALVFPPTLRGQTDVTLADLVAVGGQVALRAAGCSACGLVRSAGAVLMAVPAGLLPNAAAAVATVTRSVPGDVLGPSEPEPQPIPVVGLPIPPDLGSGATPGPTPTPVTKEPTIGDVASGRAPVPTPVPIPGVPLPTGGPSLPTIPPATGGNPSVPTTPLPTGDPSLPTPTLPTPTPSLPTPTPPTPTPTLPTPTSTPTLPTPTPTPTLPTDTPTPTLPTDTPTPTLPTDTPTPTLPTDTPTPTLPTDTPTPTLPTDTPTPTLPTDTPTPTLPTDTASPTLPTPT